MAPAVHIGGTVATPTDKHMTNRESEAAGKAVVKSLGSVGGPATYSMTGPHRKDGRRMKKAISAVLSLAFLVSFSPTVGSAQTSACPDVDSAKAMLKQMTARTDDIQAPRSLAGARQDVQAPRSQDVQAPRSQDVQAPRSLAGARQDIQAPRSQDVQAPRSQDVQAPRSQNIQA